MIRNIIIAALCALLYSTYNSRDFWKERYYDREAFVDSLYESNLELCDSLTALKYKNRKPDSLCIRIDTQTIFILK